MPPIEAESDLETLASDTSASGQGGEAETPETKTDDDQETGAFGEDGEGEETEAEGEETSSEDGDPEDEDELEFGFKKYKVAKSLKQAVLDLQGDYTRKTQETADEKRALAADRESFNQQAKTHHELIDGLTDLKSLDKQIAQIINAKPEEWQALEEKDPLAPQRVMIKLQQLQAQREGLANGLRQKQAELTDAQQREGAKLTEKFHADIQREFGKNWTPELNLQLTNVGRSLGYSQQELNEIRDVRILKGLKEVMDGRALLAKVQKQTAAAKKQIQQQAKPLQKPAGGRAPATTGLDDRLGIDAWMAKRRKQVAARGGR